MISQPRSEPGSKRRRRSSASGYTPVTLRDLLAADMEGNSHLVPPGDDIYVYVGSGVLVWRFVLYLTLAEDGAVEVLDLEVDDDHYDAEQ